MTDRKGVDSIGRGRGSDGKRGGAELRRERRRCCAAVVVLVVRTDAGRERRRAAGRCGGSSECGNGCAEDPVRVAGVEEERRRGITQTDPQNHCGAERIRAGATRRNWR